MAAQLVVQVGEDGADPQRLEELTLALRRELLDLDVTQVSAGEAPPGSRAIELAALGALLVTIGRSAVGSSVLGVLKAWMQRQPATRSIKITVGDRTLDLQGATTQQLDQALAGFLADLPQT